MAQERTEIEKVSGDEADRMSSAQTTATADFEDDSAYENEQETEQLKEQIEETRKQMGETIGAIQEKLNYENISEQVTDHVNNAVETAKAAVYEATIGKAATIMKNLSNEISGSSVVRTAKQNPFPFVLIGLGAGLLAYQSYSGKSSKSRTKFDGEGASGEGTGGSDSTTGAMSEKFSSVTGKVSDVAGTAYDKVSGAVETAYSGAGDVVNQAYSKVGEIGTAVRSKYDSQIEENPLVVGAVALALGAAVGMAVPSSRTEDEWMGNARKDVLGKSQDKAADLLDKTKEVVVEAGRSLRDQAQSIIEDEFSTEAGNEKNERPSL